MPAAPLRTAEETAHTVPGDASAGPVGHPADGPGSSTPDAASAARTDAGTDPVNAADVDGPVRPAVVTPVPLDAVAARIAEATGTAPTLTGGPAATGSATDADSPSATATTPDTTTVTGATLRAHEARPGDLFAALPGARAHGADFAAVALEHGAVAVLTDAEGAARPAVRDAGVPVLVHPDPRAAIGPAAARVHGDPSTDVAVLGVTGTSGKTTTVYLLEAALAEAGATTGLVGTVETRVAGRRLPSAFTTPEAPDLQALLAVMRERGVTHAAMEVSSHALALGRVAGVRYAVGAFTNLSAEHLDFHADMEDYFAAKARLFDGRAAREVVVTGDAAERSSTPGTGDAAERSSSPGTGDAAERSSTQESSGAWGRRLVHGPVDGRPATVTVGADDADWRAVDVTAHPDGTQTFRALGPDGLDLPVTLRLPGAFNVTNALLALACAVAVGTDPARAAAGLAQVQVPGRMQRVDAGQPFLAVVDYAHKPAAVGALLQTLRSRTEGRVLTVLGCGGDRDTAKRPVMGRLGAELSDALWVTDDNPRSEDPAAIRAAVLEGARGVEGAEVHEQGDRRAAIRAAVAAAHPGDVVVVAGKGHETGQKVGDVVHPFSDVDELRDAISALAAGHGPGAGPA